jgi:hypothetical protein
MNFKRIVFASLLAAVVAFMWGFLSWTKLTWHNAMKFKDGAAVASVVKQNISEHGIYMWPEGPSSMEDKAGMERYEAEAKAGPVLWVMAHPGVANSSMGAAMGLGFLRAFLAAFILSLMLSHMARDCFRCRVIFCVMAYFLVAVNSEGPFWIWFNGPVKNLLIMTADHLIEGLLVGLVLAKFIRPAFGRS